jgi:uncharacterized membrane protein YebE (DUF533 family)
VFNATELLGQMLQFALSDSARSRLERPVGAKTVGPPDGTPGGLAEAAEEFIGADRAGRGAPPFAVGGQAALARAAHGGGCGARSGGDGALALLSGLALSALGPHQAPGAGQGRAADTAEADEPQQSATLILAAMINAAKADGQIDQEELQRIIGKLREAGASAEALDFVLSELRKPMDLEGLIRRVPSRHVGVQLYAASLLAIELDTEAERRYLRRLAHGLGLEASVVRRVHQCMGVGHA